MSAQDTPRAFPTGRYTGMSMRDWFATHAPEPPEEWWGFSGVPDCAGYAYWNYEYADAMMAQRALPRASDGQGEG